VRVPISHAGKEPGQGVGFLEDGSMVVAGDAAGPVGGDAHVRTASSAQTPVARLLLAALAGR
jgi:uncharacterized protein YacL